MSGQPDYQCKEFTNVPNKGPIPEGQWIVRQSNFQNFDDLSLKDKAKSYIGSITKLFGVPAGSRPGAQAAWGNYRVWLEPAQLLKAILTKGAIMKIIKQIPSYLLSGLYAFAVFIIAATYPDDVTSDSMPWNAEALGWAYENRFNYTIMILTILLIIIAPTVYAWKKRKTNLIKAYIILPIPASFIR